MTIEEYNLAVDNYADRVYRFAVKNLGNEEADDVVQESYLRLWTHREDVTASKARSWLFSTAYNIMVDGWRKAERKRNWMEGAVTDIPKEENNFNDLQSIIQEALMRLPEIQRNVVMLRDYEGYNYDEIGEICKLSESQVKVYIYRARVAMKKYIGNLDLVL